MELIKKELDNLRVMPNELGMIIKFSSAINAVVSTTYLILSILGIIFYFNCDAGLTEANSKELWSIIYKVYLQDANCHKNNAFFQSIPPGLTQARTVFVLNTLLLSSAAINLITSVALLIKVQSADPGKRLKVFVCVYLCAWAGTLVIDLTLATQFGQDIMLLAKMMDQTESYDIFKETLRVGAFFLMSISMKGYIIPVITLVVITVLITFLWQHTRDINNRTRSMQRLLRAFEGFGSSNFARESSPPRATGAALYEQEWSLQTRVHTPMQIRDCPFSYLEHSPSPKPAVKKKPRFL